ncbi:MAG: GNAT family N-acetyltransferase [Dysgonomonas sp.]
MIYPKIIKYKSQEYDEMIALRHKILREPLSLSFTEQDLQKDKDDFLLALFMPRTHQMIACCILTPLDDKIVKLRQMAVDDLVQKSGMGTAMLSFAEYVAVREGFQSIELNAREIAVGFYQKYDYKIVRDKFTEVGIPHYGMRKQLKEQ